MEEGLGTPLLAGGNEGNTPPEAATGAAGGSGYKSHFTLRIPTSTVHFRGSVLHVIDTDQDQIVVQRRGDEESVVRRASPATHGQRFLRAGYTLVTVLFLGFLFVFCLQVLLFLFVALPVNSGHTSGNRKVDGPAIVSTLLAIPVMLHGMSSLMGEWTACITEQNHDDSIDNASLNTSRSPKMLKLGKDLSTLGATSLGTPNSTSDANKLLI